MKYLFVGRHNNDIDWTAPVAARLLEGGDEVTYFLAAPELDPDKDFRLAYLAGQGCRMRDIWSVAPTCPMARLLRALWKGVSRERTLSGRFVRRLSSIYFRRMHNKLSVDKMMADVAPDMVAFDWVNPSRTGPREHPPYCIGEIAAWACGRGVPTVALPHGLWLLNRSSGAVEGANLFDRIFVESGRRKKLFAGHGIEEGKIAVSGAPRYDPSWMRLLDGILPPPPARHTGGGFVITFFATKMPGRAEYLALVAWLKELAGQDGVRLIVQPHPRDNRERFAELAGVNGVTVDVSTPASVLIRLSDAVSTLVSSVVVDAICLGRPVLYPKFLHGITTRFEDEGACLPVGSAEETAAAVRMIKGGWRPDAGRVESFLEADVFGQADRGATGRIAEAMRELAEREHIG